MKRITIPRFIVLLLLLNMFSLLVFSLAMTYKYNQAQHYAKQQYQAGKALAKKQDTTLEQRINAVNQEAYARGCEYTIDTLSKQMNQPVNDAQVTIYCHQQSKVSLPYFNL